MAKKKAEKPETKVEVQEEVKEERKEDEPKPSGTPHYKSRLAALNEIAETNRQARAEALAENAPEEKEEQAEEQVEEETKQEAATVEVETKRKFIIDGKEVELTDEEITQHVQKSATADTRLREAARLFEDAKKLRTPTPTDVSPASPTHEHAPSNGPLPASSADAGHADQLVGEITAAIVRGDEEQISQALRKAFGGQQGAQAAQLSKAQGLEPEQVQRLVLETIAFNSAKQLLETPPEQGGFNDVWSDPLFQAQFERRESELRAAGDKRPYRELYSAIAKELRDWRDQFISKHVPKTGLEDRDSLKAKTGVVRGAGGKVPATPLVSAPKSHEEKIEAMRRARGLN